jgi:oxygen-independent coproporphyrinogen-3 oxidase
MVDAICREIELRKEYLKGEPIGSIYFGGGTPSVLSLTELEQILNAIRKIHSVEPGAEITLEANPDDLDIQKLTELKQACINRLSIGIQSFHEDELKWMNRSHTAEQSVASVKNAKELGFDNITIDLIYGSKFQDMDSWKYNLQKAFDLDVQHISAYNLTIEEKTVLGTLLKKGKEPSVNDEFSNQCFDWLISESRKHGFIQYEISNFGKKDLFAVHNSNYWKGITYLGLGPSAHSFDGETRQWNSANNQLYMDAIAKDTISGEKENLSIQNRYNEYILTRLRTIWGVDADYIRKTFGETFLDSFLQKSSEYIQSGDLFVSGPVYALTDKGKAFADKISSEFFEE